MAHTYADGILRALDRYIDELPLSPLTAVSFHRRLIEADKALQRVVQWEQKHGQMDREQPITRFDAGAPERPHGGAAGSTDDLGRPSSDADAGAAVASRRPARPGR